MFVWISLSGWQKEVLGDSTYCKYGHTCSPLASGLHSVPETMHFLFFVFFPVVVTGAQEELSRPALCWDLCSLTWEVSQRGEPGPERLQPGLGPSLPPQRKRVGTPEGTYKAIKHARCLLQSNVSTSKCSQTQVRVGRLGRVGITCGLNLDYKEG